MISVIIVNYNSAYLTKRAVESVFRENENIEIFIVDNTTTSEEQECLRAIFKGQRVALIFNKDNVGFAKACNQAFSSSQGEYIFLLNPDAYLIPPCLSILKEFLANTPNAASVSPLIYWDNENKYLFPYLFLPSPVQDFRVKLSQISHMFGYLSSLYGRKKNLKLWTSSEAMRVKNLSGGTVMLRRSAIEDVGYLFDDKFFLFYEDNDLFIRLAKAGYTLYVVPAAKAVHSYKHTHIKLDLMSQSRIIYYENNFSSHPLRYISDIIPNSSRIDEYTDAGEWDKTPCFPVPADLEEAYLYEWSFNPFFIPSVGYFGKGQTFILSEEIWNSIDKGKYYSRFSDYRKFFCPKSIFTWRKI